VGIVDHVRIETLDHVARWMADRDELADFVTRHLGMHIIDRTEKFTLVGSDARRGKLTLFAAEGERIPGPLARVGLRVRDLDAALGALPADLAVQRRNGLATFGGPQRLGLALAEDPEVPVDYDLDHVLFRVAEPSRTFAELRGLGFDETSGRLRAGESWIDLEPGERVEPESPLLNHLGLRVESAEDHLAEAERRGLDVVDVVDGANTYAVFVQGPDGIKLEYVEHKPTFSLV
jgi:catechol 2,3-dioxygenase-like lactoylglutathione lyase family enzyme